MTIVKHASNLTDSPFGGSLTITPIDRARQIARRYYFPPDLARHINWDKIGAEAGELAASFEAQRHTDGGITVTIYWEAGK